MPSKPIDHALKAEVEAAVRAGFGRKDVIARFKGKASLAALYAWIAKASVQKAADDLSPPPLPQPIVEFKPRTIEERFQQCYETYDAMLAMSRREDGTIRNVRIAAGGAEGIRKTLQTQISATAVLQARKTDEDRAFIDDVVAAISVEPAEIRNRIVQRLRAVNSRYGV